MSTVLKSRNPAIVNGTWATILKSATVIFVFGRANSENSLEDSLERRKTRDEKNHGILCLSSTTMCQAPGTKMNKSLAREIVTTFMGLGKLGL